MCLALVSLGDRPKASMRGRVASALTSGDRSEYDERRQNRYR